jgi:hypothetical protein
MSVRARIRILRPSSCARDLVDQLGTLVEEVRWQRADALMLALQDHPLRTTLWAIIEDALGRVPRTKETASGRAAS